MPRRFLPPPAPTTMSSMRVLVMTSDYGYVALVGASSSLLLLYQGMQVVKKRKEHKIEYPKMYDEKYPEFNCLQRAHGNTLENYPQFLTTLFLGGLEYPRSAAGFGLLWIAGRVVYTLGYGTGEPKKRMAGAMISTPAQLALLGLAIATSVRIIRGAT